MSKEKLVPKLRFEEFKSCPDWEKYVIGDLMNVTSVKRIHQSDWKSSGVRFLRARDIVADYKKENMDEYLYISKERYEEYSRLSGKVQKGDLLVTGVGTIGVPYLVKDESPLYFKDGNIIWFKNNNQIEGNFLYNYFVGSRIQEYINNAAGIGTVGTYTITSGQKTPILLPNYSEQNKIGSFFKNIDELIQLQQSKVNKVKYLKSAYLSEMFPKEGEKYPKKRFEGFTKPWQLFKLGELGQFKSNGVNKKIRANDNPAYLLNYMDVYNKLSINQMNYKDLMKVTATSRELQENNIMKNDVFFTPTSETADDIGRVLTLEYDLPETVYSYHLIRFRPFEDKLYSIFPNYGFATKYLRKQMEIAAQGVQRFVISVTAFKDLKVYLPSYEEQIKIANFFKNLDNQISIEEEKLVKLEKLKQAYLNDMFV